MGNDETKKEKRKDTPTVSAVLPSGDILEMVFRPESNTTVFSRLNKTSVDDIPYITIDEGHRLVPYSATNNLITHGAVLFPSAAEPFESEAHLLAAVRAFIHRYVDVSPDFEILSAYYVLFSWVYDKFNELPYLRVRGDYGTGKSRFLLTVGSLCYKPIFASGASSVSPLFRMIDAIRGTLVMDEGDFRLSDERAEIIKILNNGNAKGFPVLRSEATPTGEYNPRAFFVFGPKVIATRRSFEDRALESRCITEELGSRSLREDVPLNLGPEFHSEAAHLRNQLLTFRFLCRGRAGASDLSLGTEVEPRVRQILGPLLSTIANEDDRMRLISWARSMNQSLMSERGLALEAELLEVMRDLRDAGEPLSLSRLAEEFGTRHGQSYGHQITPRWIGRLLRQRLGLEPSKSHGVFVVPISAYPRLDTLFERYGVSSRLDTRDGSLAGERVDEGDMGDIVEGVPPIDDGLESTSCGAF